MEDNRVRDQEAELELELAVQGGKEKWKKVESLQQQAQGTIRDYSRITLGMTEMTRKKIEKFSDWETKMIIRRIFAGLEGKIHQVSCIVDISYVTTTYTFSLIDPNARDH